MAVNRTSSTAMAPMISFARRDSVGTDTGGRMATSGLLQLQCGRGHGASASARGPPDGGGPAQVPLIGRTTLRTVVGSLRPPVSRQLPPRAGGWARRESARRRGAAGPDVGERGQRVVQGGHPGQAEPWLRGLQRRGAVAGRDEEERCADLPGG